MVGERELVRRRERIIARKGQCEIVVREGELVRKRERERESERESNREGEQQRERERVCVRERKRQMRK